MALSRQNILAILWPLFFQICIFIAGFIVPAVFGDWRIAYMIEIMLIFPSVYAVRAAVKHSLETGSALLLLALANILNIGIFAQVYASGEALTTAVSWTDALYFSIVTWTTLGYGDFQPQEYFRLFAAIEAIYGYMFLGLMVGLVGSYFSKRG